jgi:hydroxylysine kinase
MMHHVWTHREPPDTLSVMVQLASNPPGSLDVAAAGTLLQVAPPPISADVAEGLARRYYGTVGVAAKLSAERDSNFRLTAPEGVFLLKISNRAEDPQAVAAQTDALIHIAERDPGLPVPRVLTSLDGDRILQWSCPEGTSLVRMLSYLPGTPLVHTSPTTAQRRSVGTSLGRLAVALRDFDHPGSDRPLLWDITRAGELSSLLHHIADPADQNLASRFLAAFKVHALPVLPTLRAQVLHNDFNPHNLLVDPAAPDQLAGIIDFGDMVRAPMVNDLAIAAAYDVPDNAHPLAHAADLVGAYHAVNPLMPEEVDVLFDLIAVRQVVSVVIGTWRAQRYPENRDYILRNSQAAWCGLRRFSLLDRAEARAKFRAVCDMVPM